MHAGKIRTANVPHFRLEPRDAVYMICFVGVAAYLVGFVIGLAF